MNKKKRQKSVISDAWIHHKREESSHFTQRSLRKWPCFKSWVFHCYLL